MVTAPIPERQFEQRYKDEVLYLLGETCNVAQFVSLAPDLTIRFSRIRGVDPETSFDDPRRPVEALFSNAPDSTVNVRSFRPGETKGQEFVYGLKSVDDALATAARMTALGLFVIVNETVDVNDGGVSGVSYAGICEFAPLATPRCVEEPGTAAFPLWAAQELLDKVYGFRPSLDFELHERVEFSIHPLRRGYRHDHTIIWEVEEAEDLELTAEIRWPNRFSKFVGDKAFGLLVAETFGLLVPRTIVVGRGVAPFVLGTSTGTSELWIRTCPEIPVPGFYTTQRGWLDPFALLRAEDPEDRAIRSVLSQEGVDAYYSGAALTSLDGALVIEGVEGTGDAFMQGDQPPEELPERVGASVKAALVKASEKLGPVRMEWVHDGNRTWTVQLHVGTSPSSRRVVFPGAASEFVEFPVESGIGALREVIASVKGTGKGVRLIGPVGITSHFGDLLRRARIPSVIGYEPQ